MQKGEGTMAIGQPLSSGDLRAFKDQAEKGFPLLGRNEVVPQMWGEGQDSRSEHADPELSLFSGGPFRRGCVLVGA